MINLKNLLNEVEKEKASNLASIEDYKEWKWPDVEHLFNMKFDRIDDTTFILDNPPIKLYKIKKGPFIVEEPIENHQPIDIEPGSIPSNKPSGISAFDKSKQIQKHQFKNFYEVIDFFDKYQQD